MPQTTVQESSPSSLPVLQYYSFFFHSQTVPGLLVGEAGKRRGRKRGQRMKESQCKLYAQEKVKPTEKGSL